LFSRTGEQEEARYQQWDCDFFHRVGITLYNDTAQLGKQFLTGDGGGSILFVVPPLGGPEPRKRGTTNSMKLQIEPLPPAFHCFYSARAKAVSSPKHYPHFTAVVESQRDSVIEPGVAESARLPWV
jgi:hypothetical protein